MRVVKSDTKRQGLGHLTKYVRVRSKADSRFVEFDFAIGDPSLFVELVMPKGAFDAFCATNEVVHMTMITVTIDVTPSFD